MNKQEYLFGLEKALKIAHVEDSADILEEYAEHFDMKMQDGYSEEEIAARLLAPKEIADQFSSIKTAGSARAMGGIILKSGLVFVDIVVAAFFILLLAWVVALAGFAVAVLGSGVVAVLGISATIPGGAVVLPVMPYICSLLLGLSLLALAVLSAIGAEYCRLYVMQIRRAYARWHGGVWGKTNISPPLPLHPVISPKKRRIMRRFALIALAVFVIAFIAGLGSMMLAAKSIEPWHVWGWFQ